MAKVLVLGGSLNQLPYLRAIKKRGHKLILTDINSSAPGQDLADRFMLLGYDDADGLRQLVREEKFCRDDHIFTAASHFAYEGAVAAAGEIGLRFPSSDAIHTCLDKCRFYSLLTKLNIPVPPFKVVISVDRAQLDNQQIYYLKSDYGKSPHYCYRIEDGCLPDMPQSFDRFYRRAFVLQKEKRGMHLRINLYGGEVAVFLKISDRSALPLPIIGSDHADIVRQLRKVVNSLGLQHFLVKFDLIIDIDGWAVIDLGLDPPTRLRLLVEDQGVDFADGYVAHYLGERGLPPWEKLYCPSLVQGDPGVGYRVIPLEVT